MLANYCEKISPMPSNISLVKRLQGICIYIAEEEEEPL